MAGSREEMAAQAVLGYRAQPTLLDKFNYVANYVAYASVTQLLYNANKDPEIWDDNDNLITDKAQLDEERRKHPDAYFTPEEQRELGESADLDKVKKTAKLKIYKTPLTDDEFRVVPVSYKVYTKQNFILIFEDEDDYYDDE